MPGQGELLMQNALGQDQQKLCAGWEVPDEDFGPLVLRNSSLFPGTWLEYLLSSSAATVPWSICQSTILSSQLDFNKKCICKSNLLYLTRNISRVFKCSWLSVCRKKEVGKVWKLAALQYGIVKGNSNKTWKFSHHSGSEYVFNKIPFQIFAVKQKLSLWL